MNEYKASVNIIGITLEYLDKYRGKTPRSKYVKKVLDEHFAKIKNDSNGFGKKDINNMLNNIKKKFELTDFKESGKWQRLYGNHLLNLYKKLGQEEFIKRVRAIHSDNFRRKLCGSLKYLYTEIKGFVPEPEYIEVKGKRITKEELNLKLQSGEIYLDTYINTYEYKLS